MNILPFVITVDGPGGAGKGTLCQALASKLGWKLLNSGVIYRVLALSALYHSVDIKSEKALVLLATNLDVHFELKEKKIIVIFEGEDVSNKINTEFIGNMASFGATFPKVRRALLVRQRLFRTEPGLVADGRDMGTVVFPDAIVKIFLDATPEERARRRMKQLQESGFDVKLDDLLIEIEKRDYRDRNRLIAPLVPADDALILDSTKLTIKMVIELVFSHLKKVNIIT